MIGNNKYIAHFMVQKEDSPNKNEHQVEVILNELFRHIKKEMMYAEVNSLLVPNLGIFKTKNRKLRNFIRKCIKAERRFREIEKKTPLKEMETIFRNRNLEQLKSSLKQLDSLRHVFIQRKLLYNNKRLSKIKDTNSIN